MHSTIQHYARTTMIAVIVALLTALLAAHTSPAEAATQGKQPIRDRAFIITAGDSIVEGHGAKKVEAWPARLEAACGVTCRVRNVGHGGSCIIAEGCNWATTLTESFEEEVLAQRPDLALVGIGRNDLCRNPTKVLIKAYRDLRNRSLATGVPIRFTTITPAGTAWQWPCEEQRIEVNTWLRTLPGTIDFEARSITRHGLMRRSFDSGDGLHPNAFGYAKMGLFAARKVAPTVAKIVADYRAMRASR